MSAIPAEVMPPSWVEVCPVTGSVAPIETLRSSLSSLPVHTSNVVLRTSPAIFAFVDADSPLDRLAVLGTPSDDPFFRRVLRSVSRPCTLTLARIWVVWTPATVSSPTTVGFCSQSSGLIPRLDSAVEFFDELPLAPTSERLDCSFLNVSAGSW